MITVERSTEAELRRARGGPVSHRAFMPNHEANCFSPSNRLAMVRGADDSRLRRQGRTCRHRPEFQVGAAG